MNLQYVFLQASTLTSCYVLSNPDTFVLSGATLIVESAHFDSESKTSGAKEAKKRHVTASLPTGSHGHCAIPCALSWVHGHKSAGERIKIA
jgi:hypothetical protein